MRAVPHPHPGEILAEEFLKPLGISSHRLAKDIRIPATRVGEIVAGRCSITADTGLRLSRYFAMSEDFWTGLQEDYDRAAAKDTIEAELNAIKPYLPPA